MNDTAEEMAVNDDEVLDCDDSGLEAAPENARPAREIVAPDLGADHRFETDDWTGRRSLARWEALLEGDVVGHKYRVTGTARRTGRIASVSARHVDLDQPITITYLAREACDDASRLVSFLQDVKTIARVPGNYAAKVLDVGYLAHGSPYAVLERPSGWTLKEVSRIRGPLPAAEAVGYVRQACRAVAAAQSVGVTQFFLNMANLVFTREFDGTPFVKAVLFGAESAPATEILHADLAFEGAFDPTDSLLPYVPPERLRPSSETQDDARAAVWALGTVLYELVTAAPAFPSSSAAGTLAAILAGFVTDAERNHVPLSPELARVVARCLAQNPNERYASVTELAASLAPFTSASELTDSPTGPPRRPSSVPPPLPRSESENHGRGPLDRGVVLAVGVALGVAGLIGVQSVRERIHHSSAAPLAAEVNAAKARALTRTASEHAVSQKPASPLVPAPMAKSETLASAPVAPSSKPLDKHAPAPLRDRAGRISARLEPKKTRSDSQDLFGDTH